MLGGAGMAIALIRLPVPLFILFFVLAFILQLIIHESGHLVFGLLHHYRFHSFRIFSFMISKVNGRLSLSKLKIAGTGGQCLMEPTERVSQYDCVLYNLGGAIMNIIASILAVVLARMIPSSTAKAFLWAFSCYGLVMALSNGIPLNRSVITNDGDNALECMKNKVCCDALNKQLYVNLLMTEGIPLHQMPKDLFEYDEEDARKYTLVSTIKAYSSDLAVSEGDLESSLNIIDGMNGDTYYPLIDTVRYALLNDKEFICAVKGIDFIDPGKDYQTFKKRMKTSPSFIRTEYALKLKDGDMKGAENSLKQFEKVSATYPYPDVLRTERELIGIADKTFGNHPSVSE